MPWAGTYPVRWAEIMFVMETLMPGGTEPHDFTPTVRTVEALKKADLLILNGFGMEPWAEKNGCGSGQ